MNKNSIIWSFLHPYDFGDHELKMALPIFAENTLYVGCIEL